MEAEATWKVLKHRCSDLNELILSECQLKQRLQNALKASAPTPRPQTKDAAVCFHPTHQNQTTQTHPPARIASQSVQIQTDPPIQPVKKPPVVPTRSFISFLDPTLVVNTPRVRCHARSSSIDFLGSLTGFQPGLSQSVPFHRRGSLTRDSFRSIEGGPGHVFLPPTRVRRGSLAWAPAHTFPMWKRPVHPPQDSGTPTRQESRARIKAQSRAWRKETQALKRKAEPDLISPEGVVKKVKSHEEVRPRLQLPVASPSRRTEQTLEKPMKGLKPKRLTPKRSTMTTEESNDSQSEWESSGLRTKKPADNPSRIRAKLTSDSQSDDDRSSTRPKLCQPPTKEHAKSKKPKARPPPKSSDLFSPSSNTDFESESVSSPEKSTSKYKSQEFVVSTSSSDHSDSEPEEAVHKETPKSNVGATRPEKRSFNEKELIPLGANRGGDKSKSVNKPLDISMLKKRLEATKEAESAVKKTHAKIDPKPSRQFGRLPASLLKTKSVYEGTPITSDEGSRPQVNVDLEEGARYESMAPRRRISLAHRKVDSSSLDSGSSSLSQDEKPEKIRKIVTKPSEQKSEQGKDYSKENNFQEKILERIDRDGPLKLALLSDFGPPLEQIPSPDYRPQSPESPESSSKNVEDLEPSKKELKQEHRQTQASKRVQNISPPAKVTESPQTIQTGPSGTYTSVPPPPQKDTLLGNTGDYKCVPPPPIDPCGTLKVPKVVASNNEDQKELDDQIQPVPPGSNLFNSPPPAIPKKTSSDRNRNVNMMDVVLQGKTFLEHSYDLFSMGHRMKSQVLEQRAQILKSRGLDQELHLNLVQSQLGRLWKSNDKATFDNVVKQLARPEFAPNGSSMRVLFNRITFEVMRERKDDAPFDTSQKPPNVPTSTPKQIKILSLLASLKNQEGFKDILEEFTDHLYFSIFGKSKLYVKSMFQACSLVRFFIILLRIGGLEERCRLFIYDALFFKSVRNHVFMLTIIEVWPEVLKWTGLAQNEIILDPILEAMVWMIYNTGMGGTEITLKVFEARNALRNVCRLPNPECSATDIIKKFLRIGLQSKDKPHLLDSLNRAILLVSRSQDYHWNHNNLIRPLLELVGKSCQEDEDESQAVLCWAIEAIGLTSRCYPAEARKHLEHIFEALAKLLDSHKLNARGEGICLLALLRVGHHLQLQVAKFLVKWKPRNVIGLDVFEIVSNFLGTRAKKFTTKTIEISRYSENRSKTKRLRSSL